MLHPWTNATNESIEIRGIMDFLAVLKSAGADFFFPGWPIEASFADARAVLEETPAGRAGFASWRHGPEIPLEARLLLDYMARVFSEAAHPE